FLAAFLVMALPPAGYFALRAARNGRWPALLLFSVICGLSLTGIVLSVSRGAWFALAGTIVVLLAGCWGRGAVRRLALPAGVSGLAALMLVGLWAAHGDNAFRANVAERVRHLTAGASRQHIWRAALAVFQDHPVLGCGPDAFQLAFAAKRTPAYG